MIPGNVADQRFVVSIPVGLHLRPAAMLARTASPFDSEITISRNGIAANAKSAMSVIMLRPSCPVQVKDTAAGDDAEEAMAGIAAFFLSGLEES